VVSLEAFTSRPLHKALDAGRGWVDATRRRIGPRLRAELEREGTPAVPEPRRPGPEPKGGWDVPLELLVWLCPGRRDAAGFIRWLERLTAGRFYELFAPFVPEGAPPIPADATQIIGVLAGRLRRWNEAYFRQVDPALLEGLAKEAAVRRQLVKRSPAGAFERATNGVILEPDPGLERAVLIPQYHFRPWNLHARLKGAVVYLYPVDVLPTEPGHPSPDLLRLTRALADESRLRILRFLAPEPRPFSDVVRFIALAKSTVHHHLVALRAAGLIRVHVFPDGPERYSLRPGSLDRLEERLADFLEE
jgi:DNA-binding transcriptional ArsR family regulator